MGPLVTLTTDFGTRDPYVASIKGIFYSRIPSVRLVDITHEVPPFNPIMALPFLIDTLPWFPEESFHLIVIDPGVGSERKSVAIHGAFGWAILPDNGLPSLIHDWMGPISCYQIHSNSRIPGNDSPTFQARDLFAPVLVHLALGVPPEQIGWKIDPTNLTGVHQALPDDHLRIWNIDRFGNVLLGYKVEVPPFHVKIRNNDQDIPFVQRYQDIPVGETGVIVNSSGWIEVFCREGSAASVMDLAIGQFLPVQIGGGKGRFF
ncbi:MAG: SAM hydrolase/SAM-dependent halogenase family protein [Leptospirales bacterium]